MDELIKQAVDGLITSGEGLAAQIAARTKNPFDDIAVTFATKWVDAHRAEIEAQIVAVIKQLLSQIFAKIQAGEMTPAQARTELGVK